MVVVSSRDGGSGGRELGLALEVVEEVLRELEVSSGEVKVELSVDGEVDVEDLRSRVREALEEAGCRVRHVGVVYLGLGGGRARVIVVVRACR